MRYLIPDYYFRSIIDIPASFLKQHGVGGVILDTDNTLSVHGGKDPAPGVAGWIREMQQNGVVFILLSNNNKERIAPFAQKLNLRFICGGAKPLQEGFRRCQKQLQLPKEKLCVIGDQIYTDILGGNRFGIKTILTSPIAMESGFLFRVKRVLEAPVLQKTKKLLPISDQTGTMHKQQTRAGQLQAKQETTAPVQEKAPVSEEQNE